MNDLNDLKDMDLVPTLRQQKLLEEYVWCLSQKGSDLERLQRLDTILTESENDPLLSFLMGELDHSLGHRAELNDPQELQDLQAWMREYLDPTLIEARLAQPEHTTSEGTIEQHTIAEAQAVSNTETTLDATPLQNKAITPAPQTAAVVPDTNEKKLGSFFGLFKWPMCQAQRH
jgi:hypothetical protein